jgi:hypothetical protein
MKNQHIHLVFLLLLTALAATTGCGKRELSSSDAQSIMKSKIYSEIDAIKMQNGNTYLNPLIITKPEFQKLKDAIYWDYDIEVTSLQKINDTLVKADYKILAKPKKDEMEDWIAALEKLKTRAVNFTAKDTSIMGQKTVAYTDNADGHIYYLSLDKFSAPADRTVYNSEEWLQLEGIKSSFLLSKGGDVKTEEFKGFTFVYSNGSWQAANPNESILQN